MINELLRALLETALASSAAVVLVLLVRRPLRRRFGAGAGYASWLCVPAATLAVLLPAPAASQPWSVAGGMAMPAAAGALAALPEWVSALTRALPWVWASGALAVALWLCAQQRRFVRRLGRLRECGDGVFVAESRRGLPAVVGLLRPRIVLPSDCGQRYRPIERELIVQHERIHIARGDPFANALVALYRCLHWFNPLLYLAVDRYRRDQELACDERVMARRPGFRRSYCEAMLKTQLNPLPLPVGCQWLYRHPLKERIAMLQNAPLSHRNRSAVLSLIACAAVAAGYGAWAAQPARTADPPETASASAGDRPVGYTALAPPAYPAGSRSEGEVLLNLEVGVDGRVRRVELERSSGFDDLDQSTLAAARSWRFNPAIEGGRPVASWVRVPVHFRPDSDAPATRDDTESPGAADI